ncbi:STAS domain-containing protein [Streptomyces sp. NBC_01218]|uniref:STAS domain-containing protein n=1 Tax=Streptomyces sp. NBC_01218 TaxID=2903780 RepID=UPI002E0E8495|nr:STAS domain-containing protein [Streptomyces sp. NBC_01218]
MLTAHTARHSSGRAEVTAYQDAPSGRCVLYAQGAFDAVTTGVLGQALARTRVSRIVVDCSAVTFADVAFLRVLLSGGSSGVRVAVTAPSLAVCRLIEATGSTGLLLAARSSPAAPATPPARTSCVQAR